MNCSSQSSEPEEELVGTLVYSQGLVIGIGSKWGQSNSQSVGSDAWEVSGASLTVSLWDLMLSPGRWNQK